MRAGNIRITRRQGQSPGVVGMKKKPLVVCALFGIIAVVCAAAAIWQYSGEKNAGTVYEKVKREARKATSKDPINLDGLKVEIPIDFEELQKTNPDVYAWITVPGTKIDYPILQNEVDNTYYLTHTIERGVSSAGSIFTETYNSKTFEDPNTLIYGHDMKNGTMFRGLKSYRDREFFDANREIIIYTPDAIRHYKIFAAYVSDDRHILLSYDFSDREVYASYLDSIFSVRGMNSFVDTDVEVDADDKIITLSTCYGSQSDKRYLVQAVLISIEQ